MLKPILLKRCLTIGVIILFVGASIISTISGNSDKDKKQIYVDKSDGIILFDWELDPHSTTGLTPPPDMDLGLRSVPSKTQVRSRKTRS